MSQVRPTWDYPCSELEKVAMEYALAHKQFIEAYNRREERAALDDAWAAFIAVVDAKVASWDSESAQMIEETP